MFIDKETSGLRYKNQCKRVKGGEFNHEVPSKCSAAANNTRRSAANPLTFTFKGKAANALTIRKDQCLYTPTMPEFNAVYSAVVSLLRFFASKMFAD